MKQLYPTLNRMAVRLSICQDFVAIISAQNLWIEFRFGVWLHKHRVYIVSIFGCCQTCFMGPCHFSHYEMTEKIFVTKISAPNGWIDFKFGVWLHIQWVYAVLSDFGCSLILISCMRGCAQHNYVCFCPNLYDKTLKVKGSMKCTYCI